MRKYRLSYIILFIMLFFLTACQESHNDKDLHNTSNVAEDNLTEGKLTKEKAVTLETNDQGRTTAASVTSKEILNKESNKKRNFSMMLITNYEFDKIKTKIDLDNLIIRVPQFSEYKAIELTFNEDMKKEDIEKVIETNSHLGIKEIDTEKLEISLTGTKVGESYELIVFYNDEEEHYTIQVVEPTQASYRIYGKEDVYEYLNGVFIPETHNSELLITNEPKRIEIKFSDEVNQESVEKQLSDDLGKSIYTLNWEDSKTIRINLEFLDEYISIRLSYAQDQYGLPIQNNFYFSTDDANKLMYYDLVENVNEEVTTFHDKQTAMASQSEINNYILIADQHKEYSYDLGHHTKIQLDDMLGFPSYLSMGPWKSELTWVNDETVLYFNELIKSIVIYSLVSGQITEIVDLSDVQNQIWLVDIAVSPEKDKIALINDGRIHVFNSNGEKLYSSQERIYFRTGWLMGEYDIVDLKWLNNDELVYESAIKDNSLSTKEVNILKTNVITGETDIFQRDAFDIHVRPDNQLFIYSKFSENYGAHEQIDYIIKRGDFTTHLNEKVITNLYIIDENKLAYTTISENKHQIMLFDVTTGEKEKIADGSIIGLSTDKNRIYYQTVKNFLLPTT